MNISFKIARRYLFAKKSTNAINIISGISVLGVSIGTAALILILSVFNGFDEMLSNMFSTFDPDIKVTPITGKFFEIEASTLKQLRNLQGVGHVSQTLEEVSFFEYNKRQDLGILKGVDENFIKVTGIDSTLREGKIAMKDGKSDLVLVGASIRNKLGINIEDEFAAIGVYMPKKQKTGSFDQPFRKRFVYPSGVFVNQQDYERQYVLSSLEFARNMLAQPKATGTLEISLTSEGDPKKVQNEIANLLGKEFNVKNRYQQNEAFLKLMNVEKWLSFAILSLMLILVAFNLVGSLWMIVIEKKKDIAILKSMGADEGLVHRIFLNQGILLTAIGIISGFIIAIALYKIQKTFGIIAFPGGMAYSAYPIKLLGLDFVVVAITVLAIGTIASLLPARRAKQIPSIIREE